VNIIQFLKEVAKLKKEGFVQIKSSGFVSRHSLRFVHNDAPNMNFCPITAVVFNTTGSYTQVDSYDEAGLKIGLEPEVISLIVRAADYDEEYLNVRFRPLRRALLRALST
jgi:methionine salvage enolase-phosphatase E1